jgi:GDP-4-dehydro-6-deoxy-D-mannose reductase
MKNYLITGSSGFVSQHFLHYLNDACPGSHVIGIDVERSTVDIREFPNIRWDFARANMLDYAAIESIIEEFSPENIIHLASFSSVAYSWKRPVESFQNNTNIFLNLVEAVRKLAASCRILSIGSSEEYGNVDHTSLPITESQPLAPVSPYAAARISQELLSRIYCQGYGLDIVMTRSFNHIGPGQKDGFVIPSIVRQMVRIRRGTSASDEVVIGDGSIVRDFVDVRDVAEAYQLLLEKGDKGELYNVCSGRGLSIREIVTKLQNLMGIKVLLRTDENLLRPSDNRIIVGSNRKIRLKTGWEPRISLEQSLSDIIRDWEKRDHCVP